jgi:hypothetical protein
MSAYKKCKHGRPPCRCIECGGSSICSHKRIRIRCKDCGGSQICEHKRQKSQCKLCKGSRICEHGRQNAQCKPCGNYHRLIDGGFTVEEVRAIGAITTCQFPNCRITSERKSLCSDHAHGCIYVHNKKGVLSLCRQCYRGEICEGHNKLMGWLDAFPECASAVALIYMKRRPYAETSGVPY